jgi:hypothetical protein
LRAGAAKACERRMPTRQNPATTDSPIRRLNDFIGGESKIGLFVLGRSSTLCEQVARSNLIIALRRSSARAIFQLLGKLFDKQKMSNRNAEVLTLCVATMHAPFSSGLRDHSMRL